LLVYASSNREPQSGQKRSLTRNSFFFIKNSQSRQESIGIGCSGGTYSGSYLLSPSVPLPPWSFPFI
jgi:hypothetical protein